MSQANVYTTLANTVMYTDKLEITTGANTVTYQVFATALGTANAVGNIYSAPFIIPANSSKTVYCGAGNRVTVAGTPFTAVEQGTASSAQSSVY